MRTEDQQFITEVLEALAHHGLQPTHASDGEEIIKLDCEAPLEARIAAALEVIDSVDESSVHVRRTESGLRATLMFIPNNGRPEETLCNYSTNQFPIVDSIINPIIDRWGVSP